MPSKCSDSDDLRGMFHQSINKTRESRLGNMRLTVFNTPIISQLLTLIARLTLALSGWKIEGKKPKAPRFILVAAPHTSHWDLFYSIAIGLCTGVHCYWMGKTSLFWGPWDPLCAGWEASQLIGLNQKVW